MAFRSVPGAVVVGSTTAGADGNASWFAMPGGERSMISGIGVFYPDGTPMEGVAPESPTREARLYQADWLLRFYGFDIRELPIDDHGGLPRDRDPKTAWALAHPEMWPVEINTVDRELLLRVPGIGPESAKRILSVRRMTTLRSPEDLKRLHIRPKRVQNFVLFDGRHYPGPESWMMPAPTQLELFDRIRGFGRLPEDRRRIEPASGGTYV